MNRRHPWLLAPVLGVLLAACGNGRMSVGDLGGVDASADGRGGSTGVGGATATGSGGTGGSAVGGASGSGGAATGSGGAGNGGGAGGSGGAGTGAVGGSGGSGGSAGDVMGGAGPGRGGTAGGTAGSGSAGSRITDAASEASPPGPITCGGKTCTAGQDCCLLDGNCFDVADATACPKPPPDDDPWNRSTCASNAHCASGDYCGSEGVLCLGPGHCQSRANCGSGGWFFVCGCNGVTYPNIETACGAGTRLASSRYGCGPTVYTPDGHPSNDGSITFCAFDSQCPMGTQCCAITGRCYDPAKPGLCAFPPPGTTYPCVSDSDCTTGTVGDSGYCYGPGCTGPGGCKYGGGTCDGELDPVCGCNGKNYMNAKCANVVSVRVSHAGYCTDAEAPDGN